MGQPSKTNATGRAIRAELADTIKRLNRGRMSSDRMIRDRIAVTHLAGLLDDMDGTNRANTL